LATKAANPSDAEETDTDNLDKAQTCESGKQIPYTQLTIVSGGQTGADRAALDFALEHDLPHDGWCPRGRLAEDGVIPACYQLRETTSARYPQRTRWNVRDTDVTVLLTLAADLRGGTALTARLAERLEKPWLHLCRDRGESAAELGQRLGKFVLQHQAQRLNIAGPRASQAAEIGPFVRAVLVSAFTSCRLA
jgi:hypothetical protein